MGLRFRCIKSLQPAKSPTLQILKLTTFLHCRPKWTHGTRLTFKKATETMNELRFRCIKSLQSAKSPSLSNFANTKPLLPSFTAEPKWTRSLHGTRPTLKEATATNFESRVIETMSEFKIPVYKVSPVCKVSSQLYFA